MMQDLKYAARRLFRQPFFAFMIIFIFAVGTGANTAIFSLVYSSLIRPLPYYDPDQLVRVWEVDQNSPRDFQTTSISNLKDWRERNQTLQGIAAWKRPESVTLTARTPAIEIRAISVTSNFFSLLGIKPQSGGSFSPDMEIVRSNAIVISDAFWKSYFGGSREVIGSRVELDEEIYTVVGILPDSFRSPAGNADVWFPMLLEANSIDRGQNYLQVIARTKSGLSVDQAQADLDSVARGLEKEYPSSNLRQRIVLIPMQKQLNSPFRLPLMILFATVGIVLLIACLNISNLLVVHGFDRQREFAIRMALGGSRFRIVKLLLTEYFLLFLAGGIAGIFISKWVLRGLLLLEPELLPDLYMVRFGPESIFFAVLIGSFAGVLFGLLPSIQFRRAEVGTVLKAREKGASADRAMSILRNTFVILQISFSLTLLISAALLIQSFIAKSRASTGFDGNDVLIVHQAIDGPKYSTPSSRSEYYSNLIEHLKQIPEVKDASASTVIPMGEFGIDFQVPYSREDGRLEEMAVLPQAHFRAVTPGYFQTLRVPLLQGRVFTKYDDATSPLSVIVNEALAKKEWPTQNPVGKKIRFFWSDWRTYRVVGIVANTLSYGVTIGPVPELYVPNDQIPYGVMNVLVRMNISPGSAQQIRNAFLEVDPLQPVQQIDTMKSLIDHSIRRERFVAFLVSAFGIISMILASCGIYATISFLVSRRTQEIGIRMAIGASGFQIHNWILKEGLVLLIPGILLGIVCTLASSSLLKAFLYGIPVMDVSTLVTSIAVLILTTLLACFLPARRAATMDPNVALHCE